METLTPRSLVDNLTLRQPQFWPFRLLIEQLGPYRILPDQYMHRHPLPSLPWKVKSWSRRVSIRSLKLGCHSYFPDTEPMGYKDLLNTVPFRANKSLTNVQCWFRKFRSSKSNFPRSKTILWYCQNNVQKPAHEVVKVGNGYVMPRIVLSSSLLAAAPTPVLFPSGLGRRGEACWARCCLSTQCFSYRGAMG